MVLSICIAAANLMLVIGRMMYYISIKKKATMMYCNNLILMEMDKLCLFKSLFKAHYFKESKPKMIEFIYKE